MTPHPRKVNVGYICKYTHQWHRLCTQFSFTYQNSINNPVYSHDNNLNRHCEYMLISHFTMLPMQSLIKYSIWSSFNFCSHSNMARDCNKTKMYMWSQLPVAMVLGTGGAVLRFRTIFIPILWFVLLVLVLFMFVFFFTFTGLMGVYIVTKRKKWWSLFWCIYSAYFCPIVLVVMLLQQSVFIPISLVHLLMLSILSYHKGPWSYLSSHFY